jgi:AraC-like DNA-binding protein
MVSRAPENDESRFATFVQCVVGRHVDIETPGPFEHRAHWSDQGFSFRLRWMRLRSGVALTAMRCSWDRAFELRIRRPPSHLQFDVTRGPSTQVTIADRESYLVGGGTFQIGHVKRAVDMRCGWDERSRERAVEHVSIGIDGERLRELLGAKGLPAPLERVLASTSAYSREDHAAAPALYQAIDEMMHADGRGRSRQLHLEAKGFELLAALVDLLEASENAAAPRLCASDVERLERARRILLERLQDPPSLPELAREAGLNEAKLKVGFRTLVGSPVYAYLREQRLALAHRLLRERSGNVTEVAQRVGYANPSKFATAFRKRFNIAPSSV